MINEKIRRFIEESRTAMVASADEAGIPHLAAAIDLKVQDETYLLFENWFCTTTLRNVETNPHVAVAVTSADLRIGYQFIGTMSRLQDEAMLDGYAPGIEGPKYPQTLTRMKVRVEKIMEFFSGVHSDSPVQ